MRPPCLLLAAACALVTNACGGGDGGGGGTGPTGQATLSVDTLTTGPSERAQLPILLRSDRVAAGFQVDVVFDTTAIPEIANVAPEGRAARAGTLVFQNVAPGRTRILLFDQDGQPSLASGDGPVAVLSFDVSPSAPAGAFPVDLQQGLVVNGAGEEFDLTLRPGTVTVVR